MQWLIQHTGLPDNQTTKLLDAVKEETVPFVPVGHVPFSHEITGLDGIDRSQPAMFYGSVQLTRQLSIRNDVPACTLYNDKWFDPRHWIGKRPDLLNEFQQVLTVKQLRERWVDEPTFIKPIDPVSFKGQVLEPEKEDHDCWLVEHCHLGGEDLIVASPVYHIEKEWRFFLFDDKVLTGSLYKRDGYICTKEPLDRKTLLIADRAASEWKPAPDIVMDIAMLRSGEYKVIEFNCFNSSGFYNSDVRKIVRYLRNRLG